jgi:hypothetical protein
MKRRISFYLFIAFILFISGCATPNLKKAEGPFTPYDRPSFSILSPAGYNWSIMEETGQNNFSIVYLKKPDGQNHSVIAAIDEVHGKFNFKSPEDFLLYEKTRLIEIYNQGRYDLIEENIELDNRFGIYCVRYYMLIYDLKHKYKNETSRIKSYGYIFLHPNVADLKIGVFYSERGFSFDMSQDFISAAIEFTEGLNIK